MWDWLFNQACTTRSRLQQRGLSDINAQNMQRIISFLSFKPDPVKTYMCVMYVI